MGIFVELALRCRPEHIFRNSLRLSSDLCGLLFRSFVLHYRQFVRSC